MKKNASKLHLSRETLQALGAPSFLPVNSAGSFLPICLFATRVVAQTVGTALLCSLVLGQAKKFYAKLVSYVH